MIDIEEFIEVVSTDNRKKFDILIEGYLANNSMYQLLDICVKLDKSFFVKRLLKYDVSRNSINILGNTPLLTAVISNNLEITKILIYDHRVDLYAITKYGDNVLQLAVKSQNIPMLKKVLDAWDKIIDLDDFDLDGSVGINHDMLEMIKTDIYWDITNATHEGDFIQVKRLFSTGFTAYFQSKKAEITLLWCAIQYKTFNIAIYLIKNNANIYHIDRYGNSYLHYILGRWKDLPEDEPIKNTKELLETLYEYGYCFETILEIEKKVSNDNPVMLYLNDIRQREKIGPLDHFLLLEKEADELRRSFRISEIPEQKRVMNYLKNSIDHNMELLWCEYIMSKKLTKNITDALIRLRKEYVKDVYQPEFMKLFKGIHG